MACFTLLLVAILTFSKATTFPCSDRQPPGSARGDDIPGTQQVTTLQYCLIDNCTVMRIDTGEKLDIMYITESLLVATPKDGHTSVMIAKHQNELHCFIPQNKIVGEPVILIVMVCLNSTLLIIINGIVFIIHLMFKQLRSTFGKVLMTHNLGIICLAITLIVRALLPPTGTERLLLACHIASISLLVFSSSSSASATCMLHFLMYILYRSNKLQQISKEESKSLFRCYVAYILGSVFAVSFLTLSYDVGINNGAYIFPNMDCGAIDGLVRSATNAMFSINKSIQIGLFAVYLYYKYQLNKDIQNPTILNSQEKRLHRIAVAIGTTVGIAHLFYIIHALFGSRLALAISYLSFLIQHCVIMTNFLCTKKMKGMCKE